MIISLHSVTSLHCAAPPPQEKLHAFLVVFLPNLNQKTRKIIIRAVRPRHHQVADLKPFISTESVALSKLACVSGIGSFWI